MPATTRRATGPRAESAKELHDGPDPANALRAPLRTPRPHRWFSRACYDGDVLAVAAVPSRRDRLIAVALDQFTSHGVRRTSVETIAAEAGIAKGSVYLEFADKGALFRAAASALIDDVLARATAARALRPLRHAVVEILAAKFWRFYDLVHARPHARELLEARDLHATDLFRVGDDRYAKLLAAVLASARAEWRPRRRYRIVDVRDALLRAAHGTGYGGARLDEAAYRDRLSVGVDLILTGSAA